MRNAATAVFDDSRHTPTLDTPVRQNSLQENHERVDSWDALLRRTLGAREDFDFIEDQVENEVLEDWDIDSDDEIKRNDQAPDVRAACLHWKRHRKVLKTGSPDVVDAESRFNAWLEHREMKLLFNEMQVTTELNYWGRFDTIFGVVLCINGISFGLTTAKVLKQSDVFVLDVICLVLFTVEWCIRWSKHRLGFKGMLLDRWTRFDFLILLFSYIDTSDVFLGEGSGSSVLPALRVIRLLRLIRLVRLVRLFQDLWMLTSTLASALKTLLWALLLLFLLCYIFGLILNELISGFTVLETPRHELVWGSLGGCMLTLAQLASYSGTEEVQILVEDLGEWSLVLFLGFVCVASLCIYNLTISLLMARTLKAHTKEDLLERCTRRLLEQKALYDLRLQLIRQCNMVLGESGFSSPMVMREFLCNCCCQDGADDEGEVIPTRSDQHLFADMGLSPPEITLNKENKSASLSSYFEAASVDRTLINSIFEEARAALGGAEPIMALDDFIESCSQRAHPLDVHFQHCAYKSCLARLGKMDASMLSATLTLQELSQRVVDLLSKYHGVQQEDPFEGILQQELDEQWASDPEAKRAQLAFLADKKWQMADELDKKAEELRVWTNFDFVFSVVVLANALLLGVEMAPGNEIERSFANTEPDVVSLAWFCVHQLFFSVYIFELIMRFVLLFQIEELSNFHVRYYVMPKMAWRMDLPLKLKCVQQVPKYLKNNNMLLLDIVIMSVAFVDNFILRFLKDLGFAAQMVRVAGLVRLVRLVRLLYLVKPLAVMVRTFTGNMKLTMWCVFVLGLFLYSASITIVTLMQYSEVELSTELQQEWGSILGAMLTLAEIATCSDWGHPLDNLFAFSFWCGLLGVFVYLVANLGILNLASGIMVQANYRAVTDQKEAALHDAVDVAKPKVGKMLEKGISRVGEKLEKERQRIRDHILSVRHEVEQQQAEDDCEAVVMPSKGSLTSAYTSYSLYSECSVQQEEDNQVRSMCNTDDYCTIIHATWCSCKDAVLGFHLFRDTLASGPICDPMLSVLMWEGGRTTPKLFLPEALAADEEKLLLKGDLVFTNVPNRVKLRFQFAGNYSVVPLEMDRPSTLDATISANLEDLAPMEKGEIGARDLVEVLHDDSFVRCLASVGLRPEHAILVFQNIDIANKGRIRADDLVDGLFRLRQPTLGVDVASAKFFLRKSNEDLRQFCLQAQSESDCLMSVVQRLRGVSILNVVDAEGVEPEEKFDPAATTDAELFFQCEIQQLHQRVARLREHIFRRQVILGSADCEGLQNPPSVGTQEGMSVSEVTSANLGWD